MSAKDGSELPNPPCNINELQVDSTTEYCAHWLATVSAAQHDETSHLSQAHPLSESHPEESSSDRPCSPPAARASSRRATHHHTEALVLQPATPSSAPSRIDATPEPERGCLARVPYDDSPRVHPGPTSKYEKRPRRKTRPDRYDTRHQHRETTTLSRRERREQKREKLRSRKEIMTNFYSSVVENRQILVRRPRSHVPDDLLMTYTVDR